GQAGARGPRARRARAAGQRGRGAGARREPVPVEGLPEGRRAALPVRARVEEHRDAERPRARPRVPRPQGRRGGPLPAVSRAAARAGRRGQVARAPRGRRGAPAGLVTLRRAAAAAAILFSVACGRGGEAALSAKTPSAAATPAPSEPAVDAADVGE